MLTPAALAQAAGEAKGVQSPATKSGAALLTRAEALLASGSVVEARAVMNKLLRPTELDELNDSERARAIESMRAIETRLKTMDAIEVSVQKAEVGLNQSDLREAERQAKAVLGKTTATAEQRQRAETVLADASLRRDELAPIVPGLIEQAMADFDAQRFGAAKSVITAVVRTGVPLESGIAATLEKTKMRIDDLESAQGHPFDVDVDAALSLMQPGNVRRGTRPGSEPEPEPMPEPLSLIHI